MASNVGKVFEYMKLIGKLKRVRRTGWVLRGVTDPESVSDHMYRVAMTAVLAPPPLNADKCVKMALVHDMAECIVGDLTPHDNVSKEEKHRREEEATRHMCSLVGEPVGSQLYSLWEEYERQETEEARFVKDLDRLDMVLQAYEYEQLEGRPGFLQEFFDSTEGKFQTQIAQEWQRHLDSVRRASPVENSGQLEAGRFSTASSHGETTPSMDASSTPVVATAAANGEETSDQSDHTDAVEKKRTMTPSVLAVPENAGEGLMANGEAGGEVESGPAGESQVVASGLRKDSV
ncbi:5'-deoxynucleotidase HDDC2-like [Babylonia areolata]|uniref:5'-deoxynucleotidase HDDC2-like n=1 Tax=Babylonia areolata TaxID=304850 RepID=UPI003FD12F42